MPLHETLYIPLSAPSRGQALSLGLLEALLYSPAAAGHYSPAAAGHPYQFLQGCPRRAITYVVGQLPGLGNAAPGQQQ